MKLNCIILPQGEARALKLVYVRVPERRKSSEPMHVKREKSLQM